MLLLLFLAFCLACCLLRLCFSLQPARKVLPIWPRYHRTLRGAARGLRLCSNRAGGSPEVVPCAARRSACQPRLCLPPGFRHCKWNETLPIVTYQRPTCGNVRTFVSVARCLQSIPLPFFQAGQLGFGFSGCCQVRALQRYNHIFIPATASPTTTATTIITVTNRSSIRLCLIIGQS